MFVLTMDQKGSRTSSDRVPAFLRQLNDIPVVLAFERSVGDEVQGLVETAASAVEVAMRALRTGHWYVGIGVGDVGMPLPSSTRAASGGAFVAAREAVDRAKKAGERVPLSVRTSDSAAGAETAAAEAVLVLIGDLVRKRSASEWRVVDALADSTVRQVDAARALDISPQAVSKAILRSGWQEEHNGRAAAALLLEMAGTR
ncbi:MAG: MarR family transcriptional regulator [Specibacter sp.]